MEETAMDDSVHSQSSSSRPTSGSGASITKTLTELQRIPQNRTCADCRCPLVDPSKVHASLCPREADVRLSPRTGLTIHDFRKHHEEFAPPDAKPAKASSEPVRLDPAYLVNQRYGGHGVFLCAQCAEAHRQLGPAIAVVHPVNDVSEWTAAQANHMELSGGNRRSWRVLEAYIPESWMRQRPTGMSTVADRVLFCRAKYEALGFALPPPGPRSQKAWDFILENDAQFGKYRTKELRDIHGLVPEAGNGSMIMDLAPSKRTLPNRFVDHFCVVSSSMQVHPKAKHSDLSKLRSIEELRFWPVISDCYPNQTAHDDEEFPEHLASFVMPEGCFASTQKKSPSFFTFVLTSGNGERLNGAVLYVYDELTEIDSIRKAIDDSDYSGKMPTFLQKGCSSDTDVVFFPKCLVLISHHAFYDLYREILLQLYRISLVEAPLPIERYIANVTCEVPLPPQGAIKVEFGFMSDKRWTLERPPPNQLPLANFSFRPLFASLSASNIMVAMGCLMEECHVALLSKHYSLLCPVAEALLSLLFPFVWQGLYIPIMPYDMLDILDAPVPFLVGLHSRYLHETEPSKRPRNVIFVDLDKDVIHLGVDEDGFCRNTPSLPPHDAQKLKQKLEDIGSSVYIIPRNGIKGCIMNGNNMLMTNDERETYALMSDVVVTEEMLGREEVFMNADQAFIESEAVGGFVSVQGQYTDDGSSDGSVFSSPAKRAKGFGKKMKNALNLNMVLPRNRTKKERESIIVSSENAREQGHLLDMEEPDKFSSEEIRNAFLRFFVAVFEQFEDYLIPGKANPDPFSYDLFVSSLNLPTNSATYMGRVLRTQMFQSFVTERIEDPGSPDCLMFSESIIAKCNRSKRNTLAHGGKAPTPFLDDNTLKVTKTFNPPTPSTLGLPDDATKYRYGSFPSLNSELFGTTRKVNTWPKSSRRESIRLPKNVSRSLLKTQADIMEKAIRPVLVVNTAVKKATMQSFRDLEGALKVLSSSLNPVSTPSNGKDLTKRSSKSRRSKSSASSSSSSSSKKSKRGDGTGDSRSKAESIILNARRKQGILLLLLIKIQSLIRMHKARRKFIRHKRAIVRLQRVFRRSHRIGREPLDAKSEAALKIQKASRMFVKRSTFQRKRNAVLRIQAWYRNEAFRKLHIKQKTSAAKIQAQFRRHRAVFIYCLVGRLIVKIQALARGVSIRKRINGALTYRMSLYKQQLFMFWKLTHTSLAFRTRFWNSLGDDISFLCLSVAESELRRLWGKCKKVVPPVFKVKDLSSRSTHRESVDSLDKRNLRRCKTIAKQVGSYGYAKLAAELDASFKDELNYVEAERLQIYDRICADSYEARLGRMYDDFEIPLRDKSRKVSLAKLFWTKIDQVDKSAATMVAMFPELARSITIAFTPPSKKSIRRFPLGKHAVAPHAEQAVWETKSVEGRTKAHMSALSLLIITKVPKIMARMDAAVSSKKNEINFRQRKTVIMEARDATDWAPCRYEIAYEYLYGQSPNGIGSGREDNDEEKSIGSLGALTDLRRKERPKGTDRMGFSLNFTTKPMMASEFSRNASSMANISWDAEESLGDFGAKGSKGKRREGRPGSTRSDDSFAISEKGGSKSNLGGASDPFVDSKGNIEVGIEGIGNVASKNPFGESGSVSTNPFDNDERESKSKADSKRSISTNPFDADERENKSKADSKRSISTNPFDESIETDGEASAEEKSGGESLEPAKSSNHSTNPFSDDDDEESLRKAPVSAASVSTSRSEQIGSQSSASSRGKSKPATDLNQSGPMVYGDESDPSNSSSANSDLFIDDGKAAEASGHGHEIVSSSLGPKRQVSIIDPVPDKASNDAEVVDSSHRSAMSTKSSRSGSHRSVTSSSRRSVESSSIRSSTSSQSSSVRKNPFDDVSMNGKDSQKSGKRSTPQLTRKDLDRVQDGDSSEESDSDESDSSSSRPPAHAAKLAKQYDDYTSSDESSSIYAHKGAPKAADPEEESESISGYDMKGLNDSNLSPSAGHGSMSSNFSAMSNNPFA